MRKFVLVVRITFFRLIHLCLAAEVYTTPGLLIDGDIMVDGHEDPWDRRYGPLVDMSLKRWPSAVVPIDVNRTVYNSYDLYVIQQALQEIQMYTCLNFVQRINEKDYIYITPSGGCWSYVGRKGSGQTLSLDVPQCIHKGTVIHEVLHALGLWHEHNRSDRDEYIEVLWRNVIDTEKQVNFAKHFPEASNFKTFPYDYQSVMHYDAFTFSKSPILPTMRPKKPQVRIRDLGRAKKIGTLTETDKRKVNTLYECKGYENIVRSRKRELPNKEDSIPKRVDAIYRTRAYNPNKK